MGEHPDVFPKIYVNMIRAGEAGGILEGVLRYLTEYLESTLALKEDIKSALDLSGDIGQRGRHFADRVVCLRHSALCGDLSETNANLCRGSPKWSST